MARHPVAAGGMIAAGLLLMTGPGGCDNGGSAVETRDRSREIAPVAATGATQAVAEASRPAITANRRETVDAKIERLYQRNGEDFGARSATDYLQRMQAFVDRPPRGVETARRPNGDVLLYEPATNTFAVAARDGTPRTMFKPDDGADYWTRQKAQAPNFGRRSDAPAPAG